METLTRKQFNELVKELGLWNKILNEWVSGSIFDGRNSRYKKQENIKRTKNEARGYCAIVTSITGATGGNCWNDDTPEPFSTKPDSFVDPIVKLCERVCPDISLVNFHKLQNRLFKNDFEYYENEYYGNYTEKSGYYFNWDQVYQALLDLELIQEPEKTAILVGGLPCSGKTTLAKEQYKEFHLIDDPKKWSDISRHLRKKKIIIADPALSFKKDREELREKLEERGYFVEEHVIKEKKNVLKARAKKRTDAKAEVLNFIRDYQVEL